MILVVDASVALKWFFQDRDNEADCDLALSILYGVDQGRIQLMQPPHSLLKSLRFLLAKSPTKRKMICLIC